MFMRDHKMNISHYLPIYYHALCPIHGHKKCPAVFLRAISRGYDDEICQRDPNSYPASWENPWKLPEGICQISSIYHDIIP